MSKRLDPSGLAGAFARRSQRAELDFLVPAREVADEPQAEPRAAKSKPTRKTPAALETKPVRKARVSRKKANTKPRPPQAATPPAPAVEVPAIRTEPQRQSAISTEADIRVPSWSPGSPFPRAWSWRTRASRRLEGLVGRVLTRLLG